MVGAARPGQRRHARARPLGSAEEPLSQKDRVGGLEIAVSLDRGAFLRDGDVLLWDAAIRRAVVAKISLRDVMVIHLDELGALAPEIAMRTCVELGHALGNQHWPALMKGSQVYVPLTVDRKVMSSVMNTHRFEGLRVRVRAWRRSRALPCAAQSRRLFGGAEGPVHTHEHETTTRIRTTTPVHDVGRRRRGQGRRGWLGASVAVRHFDVSDRRVLLSGGLESAIEQRVVTDAASLLAFARTAIAQAASGDGIALVHAHRAARVGDLAAVARIDERVFARKLSSESRTMSTRMGRKAAELGAQVIGGRRLSSNGATASKAAQRRAVSRCRVAVNFRLRIFRRRMHSWRTTTGSRSPSSARLCGS